MDLPLLLGAVFVFGPVVGATIAFLATWDPRELRRQVSLTRALWNRAQASLSVFVAGTVFGLLGGNVGVWPWAALAGMVAFVADSTVNYGQVTLGLILFSGCSLKDALSRLRLGSTPFFLIAYFSLGLLGLLLAEMYVRLGLWGLLSFVVPVLLARQSLDYQLRLHEADKTMRLRRQALRGETQRIVDERRDERLRIASSLHDEVLQSLHSVTIHARVIREDLRAGRLFELDEDMPGLLLATQAADEAFRRTIRDVHQSSLGRAGLANTLLLLVRQLQDETGIRIHARLEETFASPETQLIVYQIAREALMNAARHSLAGEINISVLRDEGEVILAVQDNGSGFEPSSVNDEEHFGMQLMAERAACLAGSLNLVSEPGVGTTVTARVPAFAPE